MYSFIQSFIHSFSKYLLGTYFVSDTVQYLGKAQDKWEGPAQVAYSLIRETGIYQINTETVPIVMILQRRSTEYGEDIMGTYSNFRKERSKRSAKVP